MSNNTLYVDVAQLYLHYKAEKEKRQRELVKLQKEIEILDAMMTDLNIVLTNHGKHIYDHFEEKKNRYLKEGEDAENA